MEEIPDNLPNIALLYYCTDELMYCCASTKSYRGVVAAQHRRGSRRATYVDLEARLCTGTCMATDWVGLGFGVKATSVMKKYPIPCC